MIEGGGFGQTGICIGAGGGFDGACDRIYQYDERDNYGDLSNMFVKKGLQRHVRRVILNVTWSFVTCSRVVALSNEGDVDCICRCERAPRLIKRGGGATH